MGSGFGCGGRYPCTSMLVYNTLYIAILENVMLYKSSSQLIFRAASPLRLDVILPVDPMCMAVAGQSVKHLFIVHFKLFKIDTPQMPGQCIGIVASTPYLLFFPSSTYYITASASRPSADSTPPRSPPSQRPYAAGAELALEHLGWGRRRNHLVLRR